MVPEEHPQRRHHCDAAEYPEVGRRDAQDVAEQRGVEVAREAVTAADDGDAECEGSGSDDPDGRVMTDLLRTRTALMSSAESRAPEAAEHVQARTQRVADHCAAEDRVGEAVPYVTHLAQDHVHTNEPAQRAGEHRGDHAVAEERVVPRVGQPVHQPASRARVQASRRGACRGERDRDAGGSRDRSGDPR